MQRSLLGEGRVLTFAETHEPVGMDGYWMTVEPEIGRRDKENFRRNLEVLVRENQVRHRGIAFPLLSNADRSYCRSKEARLESFACVGRYRVAFDLYRDGRLVLYVTMGEDAWPYDESELSQFKPSRDRGYLSPLECVYQLTEMLRFVSGLADAGFFGGRASVQIGLHGLTGRILDYALFHLPRFYEKYACRADGVVCSYTGTPEDLSAEHDHVAVLACAKILAAFGHAPKGIIQTLQTQQDEFCRLALGSRLIH